MSTLASYIISFLVALIIGFPMIISLWVYTFDFQLGGLILFFGPILSLPLGLGVLKGAELVTERFQD